MDILFTMSRKIYVEAKVSMILRVEEGQELEDVLASIEPTPTKDFDIEDFQISNATVTDSK